MSGVSGTKEWSSSSENIQVGCEHDCRYCYARAELMRFGRVRDAEAWRHPVLNEQKLRRKFFQKREGTIMFPTTHDITPKNINVAVPYLKKMLEGGNDVLIVTKPHLPCIVRICEELAGYKDKILFRFTIGSMDNSVLLFWEPGATTFEERFEALKWAFGKGFKTSVSSEPYFDATIVDLLVKLAPYITDAHWVGFLNKPEQRVDKRGWGPKEYAFLDKVKSLQDREGVMTLYNAFKNNPKVKWKESIKKVVGLPVATEAGLDV